MSASQEFLHESLPLASSTIANPTIIVGSLAAAATTVFTGTKIHDKWHQYVDIGHVGVWLNGDAIPRKKREPIWIPSRFNPLNLPAYNPLRRVSLSDEDLQEGESKYQIVPPGFYWVLPGKKLQPVPVGQETDLIAFERESKKDDRRKLEISASLYWRISPAGDNPVMFLDNIDSRKIDKKTDSTYSVDELKQQAKERIQSVGRACLGRATAGFSADRLLDLDENDLDRQIVTNKTLSLAAERLGPVGLELLNIDINPVVRSDYEIHKQGLESLGEQPDLGRPDAAAASAAVVGGRRLYVVPGDSQPGGDAA